MKNFVGEVESVYETERKRKKERENGE